MSFLLLRTIRGAGADSNRISTRDWPPPALPKSASSSRRIRTRSPSSRDHASARHQNRSTPLKLGRRSSALSAGSAPPQNIGVTTRYVASISVGIAVLVGVEPERLPWLIRVPVLLPRRTAVDQAEATNRAGE